nr:uncharacterized protein LOC125181334 [Anser cygnoides]
MLGSWRNPMAYFSKYLDETSKGWPSCLRAVAATALLVQEARKLTLGQPLTVFVPHAVLAVMEAKGNCWLSPSHMAQYEAVLVDQGDIKLSVVSTLNPATLLPTEEAGEIHHDCVSITEHTYASRADLKDELITNVDLEYFTDGSNFMEKGQSKVGYAVMTLWDTVEAKPLPYHNTDDGLRDPRCPELEDHDGGNDKLPTDPERVVDLQFQFLDAELYSSVSFKLKPLCKYIILLGVYPCTCLST